jgi:hypothetical protein
MKVKMTENAGVCLLENGVRKTGKSRNHILPEKNQGTILGSTANRVGRKYI